MPTKRVFTYDFLKDTRLDGMEQAADLKEKVDALVSYLCSPKFHEDTTVQVKDVMNQLLPIRNDADALLDRLLKRP